MKFKHLIDGLDIQNKINPETENMSIKGLTDNSSGLLKDYIFVAVSGFTSDGHDYIKEAIENGACLIVGQMEIHNITVPYVQVKNSRKALGIIANNFYGNPSKQRIMIGITGTNGKTTTGYILKHILESNGKTCSLIGTVQNIINGKVHKVLNTTPNPLVLQKLLSESKDEFVVVEVSSHGLAQSRIEGITFDYCLFTNLEYEHLDFHNTIDNYFQTKVSLFDHLKRDGRAIINKDNYWGEKLSNILKNKGDTVYSIGQAADNQLRILDFNSDNSAVSVQENNDFYSISSTMAGTHNKYNTVMAFGTSLLAGIKRENIIDSLIHFEGVPGRFETIEISNGAKVVIDYAHTADAFFYCLETAKQQGAKRIFHVFGFRGNRDPHKRQEMLAITSEISDRYALTLDDLNSVSYSEMTETLNHLHTHYGNYKGTVTPDRTMAIKWAIHQSNPDDWILITGKGHEKYQQKYRLPTNSDKDTVLYIDRNIQSWSNEL